MLNQRILLIFIILFGIAIRVIFFSGYVEGDDKHYMVYAYKFSQGEFTPYNNHWGIRLGLIIPTALSFYLFGINEVSLVLFPLLCSLGSIILIYFIGKMLFDKYVGLLSAFFISFFPLEVIYSSHLFPTPPITFFTALAIFLFLKGEYKRKSIYYLLSGICIEISSSIHLSALYIALFFIIYVVFYKRKLISVNYLFFLPIGVLLIFSMEAIFYYIQTHDPLFNYHITQEVINGFSHEGFFDIITSTTYRGVNWLIEPIVLFTTEQEFGFFYYFILPIIAYFLFKTDKKITILLIWILPMLLYTLFGSVSLSHYEPLRRLPRYLSPVTIPSLLILSYFLIHKINKKLYSIISVVFLFLTSIGSIWIDNSRIIDYVPRKIYLFHKEHPGKDLLVTPFDYTALLFYSKFQINPHLKLLLLPEDINSNSTTIQNIKCVVYPNVDIVFYHDLINLHNVYVAINKEDNYLIPKNSKLIKVIQKPKRFYQDFLEKPPIRKILEGVKAKEDIEEVLREVVYLYYIE